MVPSKLKLSNFTSYGEKSPTLDFSKFKIAAISGLNGAGKSSLLDSITWCLWGTSRAGDSSDALIRLGQDQMSVEFSFELDDHYYKVLRARAQKAGGHSALEFWGGTKDMETLHNLTEGTIKSTQQKIIDTLHLTYETFTNSAFLRQGNADEFTSKGPTDRKRILADILGLNHYDILEEKAKEKSKEAQTKLSLIEYKLPELEVEISLTEEGEEKKKQSEDKIKDLEIKILSLEKDLKTLQEKKARLNATNEQQEKIKQSLYDQKQELESVTLDGKKRSEYIRDLETQLKLLPSFEEKLKRLKDLQIQLEDFNKLKQQHLEIEKEVSIVEGTLNLKLQQKVTLENNLKEISLKIADLEKTNAKCPTCGQEINKDQKHQVREIQLKEKQKKEVELSKIITQEEESNILQLKNKLESLKFNDDLYQDITKKIKELEQVNQKREDLIKKQATKETEEKTLIELRSIFLNKKSQVDKLEKEVESLPSFTESLDHLSLDIRQKESNLSQLKFEEREARNVLGQVIGLISRREQLKNEQKRLEGEKKVLSQEKQIFEELALAFGKKGIQAMIIEQAIPEIEDETNKLLDKLTEGRMKVALITQKETKTKVVGAEGIKENATVETLEIVISDEMGERPYSLYSGGEAFRVNFAIRLAISKLLTHRAGAKLQFLVIDEGFGSQDAPGRARLVEVIDSIKNDFEKIIVITHIEELKEEFPTRIEVTKTSSGSTFEIVGA